MPIQNQLSYSLGLKTQEGNKALAKSIADSENASQVLELVQFIDSKPQKRLQMDAVLTLAYVSERNPEMMKRHIDFLLLKLCDPINRVVYGSMIALAHVAYLVVDQLFQDLSKVLDAMGVGTVVTKDHGFRILVTLYKREEYTDDLFYIILEQLVLAPANQLGQYTERMIPVILPNHKEKFIETLEGLRDGLTNEYHLKRMTKHLKKLYK
ncbi:MAG: hypothetical protein AB8B73_10615 [Ekhidna sp.]